MSNIETVFTGKNYRIDWDGVFYVLATDASDDEKFDSLNELIEAHPVCAEARQAIVGRLFF